MVREERRSAQRVTFTPAPDVALLHPAGGTRRDQEERTKLINEALRYQVTAPPAFEPGSIRSFLAPTLPFPFAVQPS